MSSENEAIVARIVELYNERGIAAAAEEYFSEDIEFAEPPEQPGARSARGREDTIRYFGEFAATWEAHRSEPERIEAVDEQRVLYLSVEHLRGRDGIEMAQPSASIFTLEDGEITGWQGFWNRESALKAAGLAE